MIVIVFICILLNFFFCKCDPLTPLCVVVFLLWQIRFKRSWWTDRTIMFVSTWEFFFLQPINSMARRSFSHCTTSTLFCHWPRSSLLYHSAQVRSWNPGAWSCHSHGWDNAGIVHWSLLEIHCHIRQFRRSPFAQLHPSARRPENGFVWRFVSKHIRASPTYLGENSETKCLEVRLSWLWRRYQIKLDSSWHRHFCRFGWLYTVGSSMYTNATVALVLSGCQFWRLLIYTLPCDS